MTDTEKATYEKIPRETEYIRQSARRPHRVRRRRLPAVAVILSAAVLLILCVVLILLLHGRIGEGRNDPEEKREPEVPTIQFRSHILPILENVPINRFDKDAFVMDENGCIHYLDAPLGIDVSSHQGDIDWEQVADADIDFAMIRVGLRGYTKGGIMADAQFEQNIEGALAAGLDVGVYFFSQAISDSEAEEEASYVLDRIGAYEIKYPIVFDWESVSDSSARTNGVSGEEITRFAGVFCDKIAEAGYAPMVYFNVDQGYLDYRLGRLTDYAFWLAEYHDRPVFFYRFDLWQYTHQGSVAGIEGAVDLDLDLRAYARIGK